MYVHVHVHVSFISDSETQRAIAFHQQKRAIATEIGSAFHDILELFKTTKTNEEKKKIASDMTNETLGMLIYVCGSIICIHSVVNDYKLYVCITNYIVHVVYITIL